MSGEKDFELNIITPEKTFYSGGAEQLIVDTIDGSLGILKDFSPRIIALVQGVFKIQKDGEWLEASSGSGFMQVSGGKVVILCEKAEWSKETALETDSVSLKEGGNPVKHNKNYNEYLLSKAHIQELLKEKKGKSK